MTEKPLNILLVEDDEIDVMNVKRAFKKSNITHPLYIASNGLEALEMLRGEADHSPAVPSSRRLVLLDLNMPKMGGIEFLEAVRADPELRSLSIIVMTTSDADRDRLGAYNFNVAGYIVKPVTFSNFVKTMTIVNKYWELNEIV